MERVSGAAMQALDDEGLGWFSRRLPWGSDRLLVQRVRQALKDEVRSARARFAAAHHPPGQTGGAGGRVSEREKFHSRLQPLDRSDPH